MNKKMPLLFSSASCKCHLSLLKRKPPERRLLPQLDAYTRTENNAVFRGIDVITFGGRGERQSVVCANALRRPMAVFKDDFKHFERECGFGTGALEGNFARAC